MLSISSIKHQASPELLSSPSHGATEGTPIPLYMHQARGTNTISSLAQSAPSQASPPSKPSLDHLPTEILDMVTESEQDLELRQQMLLALSLTSKYFRSSRQTNYPVIRLSSCPLSTAAAQPFQLLQVSPSKMTNSPGSSRKCE